LQASELIARCGGFPTAFCNCSKNHFQFSVVSLSKNPNATGNIQLCPFMAVAKGR
jgi:hypothetical protein